MIEMSPKHKPAETCSPLTNAIVRAGLAEGVFVAERRDEATTLRVAVLPTQSRSAPPVLW